MKIQERFNQLQPYLRGIKLAGDYIIIDAILREGWQIKLPEGIESSSKKTEEKGYEYYMFYTTTNGSYTIDDLVNMLENIINLNLEIEEKQALLKNKVDELKKMFQDKSLDELKNLKFTSDKHKTIIPIPQSSNGVTEKL